MKESNSFIKEFDNKNISEDAARVIYSAYYFLENTRLQKGKIKIGWFHRVVLKSVFGDIALSYLLPLMSDYQRYVKNNADSN